MSQMLAAAIEKIEMIVIIWLEGMEKNTISINVKIE